MTGAILLIAFFSVLCVSSASPIGVLFVGDSLVFKNDMPDILWSFLGYPYNIEMDVAANRDLATAWATGTPQQKIKTGNFQYVILQDQSDQPLAAASDFYNAMKNFTELALANAATPLLYQTWAHRSDDPEFQGDLCSSMQNSSLPTGVFNATCSLCINSTTTYCTDWQRVQTALTQMYKNVSQMYSPPLPVLPAGELFRNASTDFDSSCTYQNGRDCVLLNACDVKHPTVEGSFAVATILYTFLECDGVEYLPDSYTGCDDCLTMIYQGNNCKDCCAGVDSSCGTCMEKSHYANSNKIGYVKQLIERGRAGWGCAETHAITAQTRAFIGNMN